MIPLSAAVEPEATDLRIPVEPNELIGSRVEPFFSSLIDDLRGTVDERPAPAVGRP